MTDRLRCESALKNLLVVDDHPLFCRGFAHMAQLLRPAWTLYFASTAAQAHACVAQMPLDLVASNVDISGDDCFALVKTIVSLKPSLPHVLISGRDTAAVMARVQNCGAQGFVSKAMEPERMIESIDAVLAGRTAFSLCSAATMPSLTTRQAEILELLAEGHGNKEIRFRLGIAERTVRAHLTSLFQLLGVSGRMKASARARELGLII